LRKYKIFYFYIYSIQSFLLHKELCISSNISKNKISFLNLSLLRKQKSCGNIDFSSINPIGKLENKSMFVIFLNKSNNLSLNFSFKNSFVISEIFILHICFNFSIINIFFHYHNIYN